MAKSTTGKSTNSTTTFNFGLTIIAVVALISVVALVALVMNNRVIPIATGGSLAQAQPTISVTNSAGKARAIDGEFGGAGTGNQAPPELPTAGIIAVWCDGQKENCNEEAGSGYELQAGSCTAPEECSGTITTWDTGFGNAQRDFSYCGQTHHINYGGVDLGPGTSSSWIATQLVIDNENTGRVYFPSNLAFSMGCSQYYTGPLCTTSDFTCPSFYKGQLFDIKIVESDTCKYTGYFPGGQPQAYNYMHYITYKISDAQHPTMKRCTYIQRP